MSDTKQIGQLNGRWSILFRATLTLGALALPAIIGLLVWLVSSVHGLQTKQAVMDSKLSQFIGAGARYTPKDARADLSEMRDKIMREIAEHYPPKWLTNEVESMSRRLEALEKR